MNKVTGDDPRTSVIRVRKNVRKQRADKTAESICVHSSVRAMRRVFAIAVRQKMISSPCCLWWKHQPRIDLVPVLNVLYL